MRFGLRTLLIATLAIGLLAHLLECLRGHSVVKLTQLMLVFCLGTSAVVLSPVVAAGILGRKGALFGVLFGALFWSCMLYMIYFYEGEIFRFMWMHLILLLTVTTITIWGLLHSKEPDSMNTHSVIKLLTKRTKHRKEK